MPNGIWRRGTHDTGFLGIRRDLVSALTLTLSQGERGPDRRRKSQRTGIWSGSRSFVGARRAWISEAMTPPARMTAIAPSVQ